MSTRQYSVFEVGYEDRVAGVAGYVTPQNERARHPEYRRHQAKTREWVASQEAEEFVDAAGDALLAAESLAGSYGSVTADVFRERAVALRSAAERLVDLAGRMS